ncbi:uncharacterized protein [Panulirus ornatus]|uniref:uncharacterized protein isoform X2 n=1 Tax=Panulirus ornatus TaxID=150431 RepID=UPI003A88372F
MPAKYYEDDLGVMATLGAQYHSSGSSSMSGNNGVSRLGMMQARLREQLMLEKESRLLEMAARQEAEREGTIQRVTKSSASNTTLSSSLSSISSLNSSGAGQGRVRKLFEERRSNGYGHSPVGRDKSYPLEPVRGGSTGSLGGGTTGRPPAKPMKGVVRNRGVSVDRGKSSYDPEVMKRSKSHAALQHQQQYQHYGNHFGSSNNSDPRSPPRSLRPPQNRPPAHHKSTSSLLDANQNYNGRGSSSSSGVYSRGPSRDPSPAPSPSPSNLSRFGFRGTPSRGPSPAPPSSVNGSPVRGPATNQAPRRTQTFNHRQREDEPDGDRSPVPPSRPRQKPTPPPRQPRQTPPPRQQQRQPPPKRQPAPPAARNEEADNNDSSFLSARPAETSQSKQSARGHPTITHVSSVKSPQPPPRAKPKPPPKPKAPPAASQRPSKPVPGLSSCKICGRNFAPDRIEKHETICSKSQTKAKKRKVFDPVKMRTKGTEAEKFVARGKHLQERPKPKKKNWKKQHEEFIAAIRAAKTGNAPPPTDNSDYIECPHCGRKFSEAAADRHIPKCANIQSNKPAAGRRR